MLRVLRAYRGDIRRDSVGEKTADIGIRRAAETRAGKFYFFGVVIDDRGHLEFFGILRGVSGVNPAAHPVSQYRDFLFHNVSLKYKGRGNAAP